MSWISRLGHHTADSLSDFASGRTPVKALDESKSAFRLVLTLVVVAFGTSGWLLWRTINTAAKLPPLPNANSATVSAEIQALKTKDTDNDGLTDYEELYSYNSSPYLYSSASDDVSDGDKVRQGMNPNCPKGKTCSLPTVTINPSSSGQVDVSFLRSALKASGASAATVDQASDSTILSLYQQATSNSDGPITNTNRTNTNSANSDLTIDDLNNLTGTQIRSLLKENGIDDATLSKVDDATLQAVFRQAISENTN